MDNIDFVTFFSCIYYAETSATRSCDVCLGWRLVQNCQGHNYYESWFNLSTAALSSNITRKIMGCYRSGRVAMMAMSSFLKYKVWRISSFIGGVHVAVRNKKVDWLANVFIGLSKCECDMMKKQIYGYGNDEHLLFLVTKIQRHSHLCVVFLQLEISWDSCFIGFRVNVHRSILRRCTAHLPFSDHMQLIVYYEAKVAADSAI